MTPAATASRVLPVVFTSEPLRARLPPHDLQLAHITLLHVLLQWLQHGSMTMPSRTCLAGC